jgi:hypothetical protein
MWEQLAELAERERELVAGASWDELSELQARRQELIDALPSPPPVEAKRALAKAVLQAQATQEALRVALSEVESALGAVRRGRRAVAAYGVATGSGLDRRA